MDLQENLPLITPIQLQFSKVQIKSNPSNPNEKAKKEPNHQFPLQFSISTQPQLINSKNSIKFSSPLEKPMSAVSLTLKTRNGILETSQLPLNIRSIQEENSALSEKLALMESELYGLQLCLQNYIRENEAKELEIKNLHDKEKKRYERNKIKKEMSNIFIYI